jgi:hypothetical protein
MPIDRDAELVIEGDEIAADVGAARARRRVDAAGAVAESLLVDIDADGVVVNLRVRGVSRKMPLRRLPLITLPKIDKLSNCVSLMKRPRPFGAACVPVGSTPM